jgi:prevent-host-death family protein
MAEQMRSISEARQSLPNLSLNAQERMDRYVITNQGRPQSVLMGYEDYQKMKASTEILLDPRAIGSIRRGLAEQQAGERLTIEQVRERLRNKKRVIAGEDQIEKKAFVDADPMIVVDAQTGIPEIPPHWVLGRDYFIVKDLGISIAERVAPITVQESGPTVPAENVIRENAE